jgi:hypothetical protein
MKLLAKLRATLRAWILDPAITEPSGVTLESLEGRPCMRAVGGGITVDQRLPLRESPLPRDTLARLRLEKLHLRARMDEVELLIDSITEERELRGIRS